ncbi:MAG: hypothetical protein LQ338_001754 [Usnochroma carphineum]|nr:MAG: hypothetical protein LQ338_001754 [Usnochroma carphineum]
MVYVACGALVLTVPILYYVYKSQEWRPKLLGPPLKGDRQDSPPEFSIGISDVDDVEKPSTEVTDDLGRPEAQAINQDATDGLKCFPVGEKVELSPQGSSTSIAALKGGGDDIDAVRARVTRRMETSELGPRLSSVSDTSKATMQPPARPGPRLRPKTNNKLSSSSPQPGNNSLQVPPTLSSTLQPPPSAASTLRNPPTRSLAPPPSAASTASTLPSSKRSSKKVMLEPGHSPLDWANLINKPPSSTHLRGDDVPSNLIRVPPSLLRYHNGRKGKNAWGVWQGKVYNLTPYMKYHPGGVDELMKGAGREKDAERLFLEVHPWVNWEGLLGECLVGILVSEAETSAVRKTERDLDDMD